MKIFYRISIFCACILVLFFVVSGYFSMKKQKDTTKQEIISKTETTEVSQSPAKTSCDTECIVIAQNLSDDSYETLIEKIPDQYIDKTRDQLIEILNREIVSPVLSEREKGISDIRLSSFSSERIVIIKQYDLSKDKPKDYQTYEEDKEAIKVIEPEGFYLMAYDDKVYVYTADQKQIYLVTNISIHELPEHLTQEILDGKYIRDEAELYNFLESYSS